jgi:hypothetical protein
MNTLFKMEYDAADRKNVIELEQKRSDNVLRLSCFRQLQVQRGGADVRIASKPMDRSADGCFRS